MVNLTEYGIDVGLLISGLFGAVLLTSKDSARNYGKTVSSLVGGAAAANYLTPVIVSFAKFDNVHFGFSIAFLLGFLGLKSIEYFSNRILPDHIIHAHMEHEHGQPAEQEPKKQPKRRRRTTQ